MCIEGSAATDSSLLHLDAHPSASKAARSELERHLKDWKLSHLLDDASLVAGELVANAAKLGSPFSLKLTREPAAVIIAVTDGSDEPPIVIDRTEDDTAVDGRGMFLVQALSQKWGVEPTEHGKTVWARVGS
jgi:anti-sigma regulatory factor (Ser/Thr protein kinase)